MRLDRLDIKRKSAVVLFIALLALTVSGCSVGGSDSDEMQSERTTFAMDTVMTLRAYGDNADAALDAAESEINRLDSALARKSESSEIYAVNENGSADVSDETAALTKRALEMCAETDGKFDITIAPVMDLWGFYTQEYNVPTADELALTLPKVDYRNISVSGNNITAANGSQIDLGGIAKGYLSDRIADIMRENKVESAIISLGGNVWAVGKKTDGSDWRVAVQDPDNSDEVIGTISVNDKAVITSGSYQRYFERDGKVYHHIIDPSTGCPAESGLKSVTIVCDDGTRADALSTAMFVMGMDAGTEFWKTHDGFDVVFITDDNKIYITEGLTGSFETETNDNYEIIKK